MRGELYIPHGSDETSLSISLQRSQSTFISHMVQMKHLSQAHLQFYPSPLYPTWFR